MYKCIVFLLMTFFASNVRSQIIIDKKDSFTGQPIKGAMVMFGHKLFPSMIVLGFVKQGERNIISFTWPATAGIFGAWNNIDLKNVTLLMKMEGDTILRFKADTSISLVQNNQNISMLGVQCYISDKDLYYLAIHKIAIFRLGGKNDIGADFDDRVFINKNKVDFQKAAAYMLGMQDVEDQVEN